ncbi:unnamed protein product [Rotaria sp. Silwood2]|nr:unnamed protein product [Rotaria sp. Silwood2]CAF2642275.1 unnamed protein product [Rotaria sp. Silwood2]CAF3473068.1 unnamed protein product [Rotaria sp. Silwood2]CAF4045477.1 unnamed protein product [Rotaria sp. Silwood2]CAF4649681.1 unnamed protein product [Rotaria sp. Silwood2]
MQRAFADYYHKKKNETDKKFSVFYPFEDNEQGTQLSHFVFVLDGSSSMNNHWNALEQAYVGFLQRRKKDQGDEDLFSVVQFSDRAEIVYERKYLRDTPLTIEQLRGGTNYYIALEEAKKVIEADSTKSSVVMIFMSDGQDLSRTDPKAFVGQLRMTYGTRHNFICHTVAFGDEFAGKDKNAGLLKDMAVAGGGEAYTALTDDDLKIVFSTIAANNTATDALVKRLSDALAEEISTKIMIDFL